MLTWCILVNEMGRRERANISSLFGVFYFLPRPCPHENLLFLINMYESHFVLNKTFYDNKYQYV